MPTDAESRAIAEIKEDHKKAVSAAQIDHKQIRQNYAAYHNQPGGVWSKEDVAKLREEGRPVLEINKIKPIVNMILGLEINNPLMMRVYAEQSEDLPLATGLDTLGNWWWYQLEGSDRRAEMFAAGVIGKRGHLILGMDTDKLIPSLVMRAADGLHVHIDPGSVAYNPDEDAEYMISEAWFGESVAQTLYPGHAREIKDLIQRRRLDEGDQTAFPSGFQKKEHWAADYDPDLMARVDHRGGRLQALEHYKRSTEIVFRLWDPETRLMEDFKTAREQQEAADTIARENPEIAPRLVSYRLKTKKMRKSVLLGGKILVEPPKDSNLPPEIEFPIVTFRAHHFGDLTTSVVDDLIDPAKQHNVTHTNILHIMQSVAHAGWLLPEQSHVTKEHMEEVGSKTGGVIEYNYPFKPERIEPGNVPIAQMANLGYTDEQLKEISGANEALRGIAPANVESGYGVDLLQRQSLAVLAVLYKNLERSEKSAYYKMLVLIQKFMPIPEEIEVLGSKLSARLKGLPEGAFMQTGDQKFIRMGALGGINQFKNLKYNVRIAPGPATRHQREYWMRLAVQLASVLPPEYFPPEALLELTDFPFVDEIIEHITNMRELQAAQTAMETGSQVAASAAAVGGE